LRQRLEKVRRELALQRRSAARSATLTGFFGVLVLVALSVGLGIGYTKAEGLTTATSLADFAQATVEDYAPTAREMLEQEVARSAPAWSESLGKWVLDGAPSTREALEDRIMARLDPAIAGVRIIDDQQFTLFLRENRPVVERAFKELAARDTLAEDSRKNLDDALDQRFGGALRASSAEALESLRALNAKLARLQEGKNLTREEQLERRLVSLLRRLQLERDSSPTGAARSGDPTQPPAARAAQPGTAAKGSEKQ
jgi:hypothetical protein